MRELSLFSGAGGGLLGTKLLGFKHVGYVEFNDYCQKVIAQRIKDGILDEAPIFGDIRTFLGEGYARSYQGMVDVVTAGFPCQPFSVCGKGLAEDDERNMWPETIAVIRQVRPNYCLLENVPGLLAHRYFGTILGDLAAAGFNISWCVLSAGRLGAYHKRERLWMVADRNSLRLEADAPFKGLLEQTFHSWNNGYIKSKNGKGISLTLPDGTEMVSESDYVGVRSRTPYVVDRLKAAGNMQLPIVAKTSWELMGPQ